MNSSPAGSDGRGELLVIPGILERRRGEVSRPDAEIPEQLCRDGPIPAPALPVTTHTVSLEHVEPPVGVGRLGGRLLGRGGDRVTAKEENKSERCPAKKDLAREAHLSTTLPSLQIFLVWWIIRDTPENGNISKLKDLARLRDDPDQVRCNLPHVR